jgi:hypothetical protein
MILEGDGQLGSLFPIFYSSAITSLRLKTLKKVSTSRERLGSEYAASFWNSLWIRGALRYKVGLQDYLVMLFINLIFLTC